VSLNRILAQLVVDQLNALRIHDVVLCPGARNIPLVFLIEESKGLNPYYWFEERSGAFFALGRSRIEELPTAIVTTSGTAAAELLPAAMEAYYSAVPLLLITADRPRRMRGSGAPQTADQAGLFGIYTKYSYDVEAGDMWDLQDWDQQGPAHLNVCFEEPLTDG
jgi:2-succinyl-5-enolpyruvyl-6-hydroxy-3-cyclohexene-1-carboxylate synthase